MNHQKNKDCSLLLSLRFSKSQMMFSNCLQLQSHLNIQTERMKTQTNIQMHTHLIRQCSSRKKAKSQLLIRFDSSPKANMISSWSYCSFSAFLSELMHYFIIEYFRSARTLFKNCQHQNNQTINTVPFVMKMDHYQPYLLPLILTLLSSGD